MTNTQRTRPVVSLSLRPETATKMSEISESLGISRSALVELLVEDYADMEAKRDA